MTTKKSRSVNIGKLVTSAVCIALCYVLPFLTGQIPEIGSMLSPMHIPVFIAGFICGPTYGMAVGIVSPLLRSLIMQMPPILTATAMAFELAAYGYFSGTFNKILPKKNIYIYISLIISMILGRGVWGCAMFIISGITQNTFTFSAFIAGAFTNAVPGIICHILLIPPIVMALRRAKRK